MAQQKWRAPRGSRKAEPRRIGRVLRTQPAMAAETSHRGVAADSAVTAADRQRVQQDVNACLAHDLTTRGKLNLSECRTPMTTRMGAHIHHPRAQPRPHTLASPVRCERCNVCPWQLWAHARRPLRVSHYGLTRARMSLCRPQVVVRVDQCTSRPARMLLHAAPTGSYRHLPHGGAPARCGCGGGGCGGWATGAADVPYCMSHTGNHIRNLGLRNLAAMIATQPHLKVVDLGGACGVGVRARGSVRGARRVSGVKCKASGVARGALVRTRHAELRRRGCVLVGDVAVCPAENKLDGDDLEVLVPCLANRPDLTALHLEGGCSATHAPPAAGAGSHDCTMPLRRVQLGTDGC